MAYFYAGQADHCYPGRRIKTEDKAMVVAVGQGMYQPFSSKDDLNNSFWENIHFGRVVVWYGIGQLKKIMNFQQLNSFVIIEYAFDLVNVF